MEQGLRDRIRMVLAANGYTANKLAGGDAACQTRLSRQLNGATITAATCQLVLSTFPEISADWLMMGIGEMKKSDSGKIINVYKQGGDGDGQINNTGGNITQKDRETIAIVLKQNQQLIDALLRGK